jgi:hypothetical protein
MLSPSHQKRTASAYRLKIQTRIFDHLLSLFKKQKVDSIPFSLCRRLHDFVALRVRILFKRAHPSFFHESKDFIQPVPHTPPDLEIRRPGALETPIS